MKLKAFYYITEYCSLRYCGSYF